MTRTYHDIMAGREARSGPEAAAYREVFERVYDIALQVIDLRERDGLTQRQLTECCGVAQAEVDRVERGSTSPTTRTLQRIAEALDADLRPDARRQ